MNSGLKEIASNHGKLFYAITYMAKAKLISKEERVKLKGSSPARACIEFIIQENSGIMGAIEKHNSTSDEAELVRGIIALVRPSAASIISIFKRNPRRQAQVRIITRAY